MEKNYEFENETRKHVAMVSNYIAGIVNELLMRAVTHDLSKFDSPEFQIFEQNMPAYKSATPGSDEYKKCLDNMKPAFDHHYKMNRHHPEYFVINEKDLKLEHALSRLTIIDLIQTFVDWLSTANRQNYSVFEFLDKMAQKYNIHPQLLQILRNTVPILEQYISAAKIKDSLYQELDEIQSMNKGVVHNFNADGNLINRPCIIK